MQTCRNELVNLWYHICKFYSFFKGFAILFFNQYLISRLFQCLQQKILSCLCKTGKVSKLESASSQSANGQRFSEVHMYANIFF